MTQTERLYYYLNRIESDPALKKEIYDLCDPKLLQPAELEEQLGWLMEGGCRQDYQLVPFADDGAGGVWVLVNDRNVAYIDSEGGAGYMARSVDDFMNILLVFRFICFSSASMKSFEEYKREWEADSYEVKPSRILDEFMNEEGMDTEPKAVYSKLVRGIYTYPTFEIDPTDEDYCSSENLLRMEEEEFRALCREYNED